MAKVDKDLRKSVAGIDLGGDDEEEVEDYPWGVRGAPPLNQPAPVASPVYPPALCGSRNQMCGPHDRRFPGPNR